MKKRKKKVLITGASTGIGLSCLMKFKSNGWDVFAHYYEDNKTFRDEVDINSIKIFKANFQSEKDIKLLLNEIKDIRFDALVNSAGCFDFSIESSDRISSIKDVFCINTIVPFLIAENVIKNMKKNNFGHIINISSIGVKFGSGMESVFYGASKSAIEAITRTLAREGSKYNVLVNTLRPGITDTEFYSKIGKDITERVKLIPLNRAAEASEIANVIYFLSNDNTFITGQIIPVSGGE